MRYFFESAENQARLGNILESWINPPTPFRHHCGVKGLGCDCIHLVVRVLEELGILKLRKGIVPDYPKDWHLHNTRELLKEHLEDKIYGEYVSLNGLKNGDIVLSHFGLASSHVGFYFDGYVYQALTNVGVRKIHVDDQYFKKHMKSAYRVGVKE